MIRRFDGFLRLVYLGAWAFVAPRALMRAAARAQQWMHNCNIDLQVDDKLALVAGSTAGIGRAIAELLANEGATVIITGRTPAGVDAAVKEVSAASGARVLG
jgi:NADP-dependent 3-hydroxy acid dehydrogenase YdfG